MTRAPRRPSPITPAACAASCSTPRILSAYKFDSFWQMSRKTACLLRFVCFGHLGVHFCQFWDFDRKILDLTIWSENFPRARRTRREGVRVGVRGYVKAGVQWLYAQIRSDLSEHPFEAADGPGISVVSTGRRPCCGVWEFCAFWRLADLKSQNIAMAIF